jgi:spermidine/putrescine transport system permease protein
VDTIAPTPAKTARGAPSQRRSRRRQMLFWLAPPLTWFTVFMLVPYALLFYYSVGSVDYMTFKPGFSAANFVRVFATEPYLGVMLKSLKLGLITAVGSAILAYPVAFCLAFHTRSERAKFQLYLLVIVPWWAAYLVKAYAWKTILGSDGIINRGLEALGLIEKPLSFLIYNQTSVALVLIYIFTPFAVLSIYAALERIPTAILEAAADLGASGWEIFRSVIFPLSLPGVIAGGIITFSLSFGDFVAPALVGGADAVMISNIVINLLGVAFDWPMAAAIGIIVIAFGVSLIGVSQHLEERGRVRL